MITEVKTPADLTAFINFPHACYAGDPNYVPQPNFLMRQFLNPKKNPFFRHSEAAYFLSKNDHGKIMGRIAAVFNRAHLDLFRDETGFFGFFDAENDVAVARELLDAAAGWLRARNLRRMQGPENFTTNDSVGILTGGFDRPPVILMPYNFPYYQRLLESCGLTPALELFSYLTEHVTLPADLYEKADRLEARLAAKGFRFRTIDFRNFDKDTAALREVYNAANAGNWGFLPLDEVEFRHMADDLRQLIDADNVWLAEREGRLAGYAVSLPDYNQVFHKMPGGRLFPFGWWHLLTGKRKITGLRIMILGVLPEFRRMGIDWRLYAKLSEYGLKHNIHWGEACYVMAGNSPMRQMMEALGARVIKQYALYERGL